MRMMVQGRLLQACFIEIHQVFAKKVGYFFNRVIYCGTMRVKMMPPSTCGGDCETREFMENSVFSRFTGMACYILVMFTGVNFPTVACVYCNSFL